MIRRINLFGGPGSGKSTLAAKIFVAFKARGHSIEHVQEYVKSWTYYDRKPSKWDQVYLFGKQQQAEYKYLANNPNGIIVTDSPVVQGLCYTDDIEIRTNLLGLADKYEEEFPSLNIFVHRGDKVYKQEGRWQNREEAQGLDVKILEFLDKHKIYKSHVDFNYLIDLSNEEIWTCIVPYFIFRHSSVGDTWPGKIPYKDKEA